MRENGAGRQLVDIRGQRFGHLYVIPNIEPRRFGTFKPVQWLCKCDCGTEKYIRGTHIRMGRIKSCGCKGNSKTKVTISAILNSYKNSAIDRGIEFLISRETFEILIFSKCEYCGKESSNCVSYRKKKDHPVHYNGVDRVDNYKGYIEGNCVSCCSLCNSMKEKLTVAEFLEHIERIHKFQRSKSGYKD